MPRLSVRCCWILLCCLNVPSAAQGPYVKQMTATDGLPSNIVYQIYRDSESFLWFATDAGVARYDGSGFEPYSTSQGLNSNEVIRIQEDKLGRLWLFHLDGSFNFLHNNTIHGASNAPFLDSLTSKRFFRRLYAETGGAVYFYSNVGQSVFELDRSNKVAKHYVSRLSTDLREGGVLNKNTSPSFMVRKNGEFIVFRYGGVYRMADWDALPKAVDESVWIHETYQVNDSIVFADVKCKRSLKKMIFKFHHDTVVDTVHFSYRNEKERLSDVFEDKAGNYWVSSFFSGVYCLKDGRLIRHFDIRKAQSITEDHEGNVWVASLKDGAYRIRPSALSHTHLPASAFQGKGILSLFQRADGGLWATDGQQLFLVDGFHVAKSSFADPAARIDQVVELSDKSVLLGESNAYLKCLKGIYMSDGTVRYRQLLTDDKMVKRFSVDPARTKIAASHHGVYIYRLQQDSLFQADSLISRVGNRIYYLYYNSAGELFANSDKVFSVEGDRLVAVPELSCFDGKIIRQHLNLDAGTELFNFGGDSLYLFKDGAVCNLQEALVQPIAHKIKWMEYRHPHLFLACHSHVVFARDPLQALKGGALDFKTLGTTYNNIHQILLTEEALVVASDDGLSFVPLQDLSTALHSVPMPYLKAALVDGKAVGSQSLPALQRKEKLQFVLGSIHFSDLPVKYAYKLDGLDEHWTYGSESSIVYQNLPSGRYLFRYKVKLSATDWSQELSREVVVRPNLWEHPLFYVMLGIAAGLLIYYMLYRSRHKELKRRKIENQMLVLEQKALNAMMNPHFVFNSLSSIQSFILKNEVSEAGLYLSKFSRLIRQNMNAVKSSMTEIEEEAERLANYLELELLRTNHGFRYQIEVDKRIEEEAMIPSMIVQPIVENAVWHGVADLAAVGFISIQFNYISEKAVRIVVEDNGIGMVRASKKQMRKESHLQLGMDLTRKRVDLLGKKMGVDTAILIREAFPGAPSPGTRVEIVVPCSLDGSED